MKIGNCGEPNKSINSSKTVSTWGHIASNPKGSESQGVKRNQ